MPVDHSVRRRPAWPVARAVVLAAVLCCTVLAGCTSTARSGDARLRGARLEVLAGWAGAEQNRFEAVLRDFERRTGATVTYTSAHGELAETLDARVQAGDPPDVALLSQPGLLQRLASAGRLVPVDGATRQLLARRYSPVWQALASQGGREYGVWFKAANKSLVWYDVASFERWGVVPPATLARLLEVAATLHAHGIAPFSLAGADPWTLTDWFENLYLATAGPLAYDRLAAHRMPWTDPTVLATLQLMRRLLAPQFVLGGVGTALRTGFELSVVAAFTRPAHAAMVSEGDFVAGVLDASTTARIGVDVDVFGFPQATPGTPAVMGGGDVAVQLRPSAAGSALLRYLASPEAATIWARAGGFLSPNLDLDISVYPDANTRSAARSLLEAGDRFRFDLSDLQPAAFGAQAGAGMQRDLQLFLADRDVTRTAQRLEADARRAFGR